MLGIGSGMEMRKSIATSLATMCEISMIRLTGGGAKEDGGTLTGVYVCARRGHPRSGLPGGMRWILQFQREEILWDWNCRSRLR